LLEERREAHLLLTVNSTTTPSCKSSAVGRGQSSFVRLTRSLTIGLSVLLCAFSALAQSQAAPAVPKSGSAPQSAPQAAATPPEKQPIEQGVGQQSPGTVTGTVVDPSGSAVTGAHVSLTRDDKTPPQETLTGDGGQFSLANIVPGPFQLNIAAEGFAPRTTSGVLHPGEILELPQIALVVATEVTQVQVTLPQVEIAEEELKVQEKQRVLGVIPNFYVSYVPDAAPLNTKQKFNLAWRDTLDPARWVIIGAFAGLQQANNSFSGYGQGAQGYAKRYGADFADNAIGTFIGSAILPSVLHQDPRYFYKGTGTVRSRVLYAIAMSVVCKGDNKRWQANYSAILGSLAAGGISNLYYPSSDRGAGLVFENALIDIGASAGANILQEFVVRKFTPNLPHRPQQQPKP
jgi:Carboxypeptidase regulatory-like domain